MKKKALFIGRFQPFHKGHLLFIQNISNLYEEIIIGIGSSQYSNTKDNPFTFSERKLMIERSLEELNIDNFKVVEIPDIHNPPKWVDHVLSIISDFDIVLSNNSFTKELFSEKGFVVEDTSLIKRDIYSGKNVRRNILNDKPWEDLVPKSVVKIIHQIKGVDRIKEISG